MSNETGEKSR
jgi:hypothetical protein